MKPPQRKRSAVFSAVIPTLAVKILGLLDLAGNATLFYYMSEEANVRQNRLRRETETQLQEVRTGAVRQI